MAKGKTVGVWVDGKTVTALGLALTANPKDNESSYGAEALTQRLRREGFLKDGRVVQVAAKASELAEQFGEEAVEALLDQFAAQRLADGNLAATGTEGR